MLTLSKHAIKRIIERSKVASFMKLSELNRLANKAVHLDKDMSNKHGFKADYYLLSQIDLVLVVNPETSHVVTAYNYASAQGFTAKG